MDGINYILALIVWIKGFSHTGRIIITGTQNIVFGN